MTPYAVLSAKPTDSDVVIRKAYHALARTSHPDRILHAEEAWLDATRAYDAVKTAERREAWMRKQAALSGLCAACGGCGVKGTRMFKGVVRICDTCGGEGRS